MLQFGHEPWIARSAYRRSSLSQLDDNDPDPNGDVTLVVSPPPRPQKYNANSTVTPVESNTATESTVASEPTAAVNDSKILKSRFRVSSKHLVLASAYFGKMLSPQWREGRELSANGTMELEVPDTDPDVFLIILNIIHSRKKRVPRAVSLEKLTELAVQTDYFQFQEALEPYPSVWVKELEKDIPAKYSGELVKWICVSWVFNYDDIFTSVTKIAQLQATDEIDILDMPIPAAIYSEWFRSDLLTKQLLTFQDTIDATRMAALSKIFTALRERRDEIEGAKIVCSYECDSLL